MTTNVPTNTWNNAGFTTPSEIAILTGYVADWQAAFSGQLYLDANDPASLATGIGQMCVSETQIKGAANNDMRFIQSQVNPMYASGRYQDGLAWLYFLTRKPALPTTVQVLCTGLDGTVIPVGAKVVDVYSNVYQCTGAVTIAGGVATATFENVVTGAIPCAANTITTIYQSVTGWDGCSNSTAGVLGRDVETQQDFEERRVLSVQANAMSTIQSLYGAVFAVADVSDVFMYHNTTSSTITISGFNIFPHSLFAVVQGGDDVDVATAIFNKKGVCNLTGNTTVTITEPNSGVDYDVYFQRPDPINIYFRVQVASNVFLPANTNDLVKAALQQSFNGQDGKPRAKIGNKLFANRYTQHIQDTVPHCNVLDIDVSLDNFTWANSVQCAIGNVPVLDNANITVIYL